MRGEGSQPWQRRCEPGCGESFQVNGVQGAFPTRLPREPGPRKGKRRNVRSRAVMSGLVGGRDLTHFMALSAPGLMDRERLIINGLLHVAFQILAPIAQPGVLIPPARWAMAGWLGGVANSPTSTPTPCQWRALRWPSAPWGTGTRAPCPLDGSHCP